MVEESAIEKKYIFYIAVDPEHLCIFDREKAEKALKKERNERAYEKCRKYELKRTNIPSVSLRISALHHFCFSFVPILASDIF